MRDAYLEMCIESIRLKKRFAVFLKKLCKVLFFLWLCVCVLLSVMTKTDFAKEAWVLLIFVAFPGVIIWLVIKLCDYTIARVNKQLKALYLSE